ncbi:SLC13 family permease [Marinilabilia salmonicolor]|jgi:di/tricarboxylate transporter|uniref:Di/tricarboxylate transporter n=1 Tax=Marinilabilia salmonicolor TaxID=989 RepID=A0A2T0XM67_9BACT|nr:SLC13 family permease [Marinilabilia salmonicolor]PRZ00035.1 di/tricarboxylate transporter [Marinilabilia salmonicolor]RCW38632.1 di/tricarboxylate transporter [Marinilabilia salmonicolor]
MSVPTFDVILVFLVLAFILISLYRELMGAAFTFFIAIMVLGIFKILTPSEILAGFANEQIAVIIMLLLLGDTIRQTSVIEAIFEKAFPRSMKYKGFLARMMIWVGGFSAFLNNTPLVAVMMPYVHQWSRRNNIAPSKLLMPLSYAAILGGCVTLIGTSTNLIVNGMVVDQKIFPDMPSLGMFDFFWVGFPMLIIGMAYLYFYSYKLLPDRKSVMEEYSSAERKYLVEAEVRRNSHLVGKTLEDSEIRDMEGLVLIEIIRGNRIYQLLSDNFRLQEGDLLRFAGENKNVVRLLSENCGLTLPSVGMMSKLKKTQVVEVVVSHNSSLITKTVKEVNFRGRFDSALLALHRNGERVVGKIDEAKLKAGDVLMLLVGEAFISRAESEQDFYLISKIREFNRTEKYKIYTLLGGTLLAILLAAIKLVPLFIGLFVVLIVVSTLKIVSPKDMPKSIDYNLAVIIAMSLALGTAMIKTGVADMVADLIISVFLPFGRVTLLFGIYLMTTVLAAYITNKAAVAIVFPISLTAAKTLGLEPEPFALVVSFAAAANFITPIGYQTNLMVYGPGNYNFKDFFKIGFPLTIIYMLVTITVLSLMYF